MDGGLEALFRENGAVNGRVRQAVLHKAERRLLVEAQSDSLLTLGQMEAIRQGLEDAMGCPVQAAFFFCGPAAFNWRSRGRPLGRCWSRACGSFAPPSGPPAGACFTLEAGKALRLRLAPGCLEMLGDGSALRRAEAAFSQAYGLKVQVLAETDEGLEPLKLPEKPDFSQAAAKAAGRTKRKPAEKPGAEQGPRVLYGKRIQEKDRIPQDQVSEDVGRVVIGGEITSLEVKETKNGAFIINFAISDHTNTLPCKLFIKAKEAGQKLQAELEATKKQGDWLLVQGDYTMDEFMRRMCVHVGNIGAFPCPSEWIQRRKAGGAAPAYQDEHHGRPHQREGSRGHCGPLGP